MIVSKEECMFCVKLIVIDGEYVFICVVSYVWWIVYFVLRSVRIVVFIVNVFKFVRGYVYCVGWVWFDNLCIDKFNIIVYVLFKLLI